MSDSGIQFRSQQFAEQAHARADAMEFQAAGELGRGIGQTVQSYLQTRMALREQDRQDALTQARIAQADSQLATEELRRQELGQKIETTRVLQDLGMNDIAIRRAEAELKAMEAEIEQRQARIEGSEEERRTRWLQTALRQAWRYGKEPVFRDGQMVKSSTGEIVWRDMPPEKLEALRRSGRGGDPQLPPAIDRELDLIEAELRGGYIPAERRQELEQRAQQLLQQAGQDRQPTGTQVPQGPPKPSVQAETPEKQQQWEQWLEHPLFQQGSGSITQYLYTAGRHTIGEPSFWNAYEYNLERIREHRVLEEGEDPQKVLESILGTSALARYGFIRRMGYPEEMAGNLADELGAQLRGGR